MNNFTNMKIAVTADQPLDEIVKELERVGYKEVWRYEENPTIGYIETFTNGDFEIYTTGFITTLSKLKEM